MQPIIKIAKICVLISIGSLSACSTMNELQKIGILPPVKVEQIPSVDQTIIQDLADAIAQIYDPLSTTLQINATESDLTLNHFAAVLAKKGFGIQRVSADQGANFVSYSKTNKTLDNNSNLNFSVTVGAVSVARKYQLLGDNIVAPASTVRLSGTRAAVTVNDTVSSRKQVKDPSFSKAQYVASLSLDEQTPIISLVTPEIVRNIAAQSANGASLRALNSSQVEVNNLFYTSQSTFASVLDDYSKIYRYVVVFGNDSMILGNRNKSLIDQLVENVLIDDDIVSLVGCSNGPTSLEIGNEGLALGRASRVTEALMARGVPRDSVLDEGCWAPVAEQADRFPSRGVVLELWRRNS
ncbi:MAG: hypothetical protein ACI8VW_002248 [bacterium]|jgi:hypothetical protein